MPDQRGEANSGAKLTEADVRRIREIHRHLTRREIAEQFGITTAMVCLIVNRKRWSHVDD